MKSIASIRTICVLFLATCIPQGYTRRRHAVDVDGIVEAGINITNLLQKLVFTPDRKVIVEKKPMAREGFQKKIHDALLNYFLGIKPTEFERNGSPQARSGFWSTAEALISNLAAALATNPDGQAIVQPSINTEQYSLLQDIRSGRVRGPVHIYGRHARKSAESSDGD